MSSWLIHSVSGEAVTVGAAGPMILGGLAVPFFAMSFSLLFPVMHIATSAVWYVVCNLLN